MDRLLAAVLPLVVVSDQLGEQVKDLAAAEHVRGEVRLVDLGDRVKIFGESLFVVFERCGSDLGEHGLSLGDGIRLELLQAAMQHDLEVLVLDRRIDGHAQRLETRENGPVPRRDRKSTRLNSSHVSISYA